MLIGIDVGGTYTDAVLLEGPRVLHKTKVPTRHHNLLQSLLEALDNIIAGIELAKIKRVALSTTLITNLIAEKKYDPVALVLTPGPGLNPDIYEYGTDKFILQGAMDYRGREIVPLDPLQVKQIAAEIRAMGYHKVAVVGKFSQRNNRHELAIADILTREFPDIKVALGHQVSGQLNYPRRIATTLLTLATRDKYLAFVQAVSQALEERKITAPVYILKADGCTLPLDSSTHVPVETIFSGPAASTLGVMALTPKGETSVVIDIGGTTTDLALILSGNPLLSTKGVKIEDFLTNVQSFAVRSVPLGGDSAVVIEEGKPVILPERKGPAYCLGGPNITPTDALVVLGKSDIGDKAKALAGLQELATELKMGTGELANKILDITTDKIRSAIEKMFWEWEAEPAYRVWEVMQKTQIRPDNLAGVGGAAAGIIPALALKMNCRPIITTHAEVANAIGAAVAKPTLMVTLRADTEQGAYTILEEGYQGQLPRSTRFDENSALILATEWLHKRAEVLEIEEYSKETEVIEKEVFNMVRGWSTTGKLYSIAVQNPRGIITYVQGGENNA